jgi:dimethylamine monooxygenase subunit C
MLVTGIKSKPVYAPLAPDLSGRYHLMVGLGEGLIPLLNVIKGLHVAAPASSTQTTVLVASDVAPQPARAQFGAAGASVVHVHETREELLKALEDMLARCLMGTRLYVAGPESFIGLVMRTARRFNLNKDEVRAEECGSLARRVYCIHCQTAMEDVTTNIVQCNSCAAWLLVRDHYSARLAAYMGVMVDAEVPGERPDIKESFR